MQFRPFDPDRDYPLLEDLHNRFNPDYRRTAADLRMFEETRPDDSHSEGWVGTQGGRDICAHFYAEQFWANAPGRKIVEHYAGPEEAPEAIGAILEWCYERAAHDGTTELNAWSRDDRPQANAVFASHGFRLVESQPVSRLDLRDFPFSDWPDSVPGFEFTTVAQLESDGVEWRRKWYDSTREMAADIPSKQPITPSSFEQFCEWLDNPELFSYELMCVALEGDRIVSYSGMRRSPANPGMSETGLSGTVRSHRRRGLVTALKVFSFKNACEHGIDRVQTDNLDHNPMFGINQRLGFRTAWSWIHYLKEL